MMMSNEDNDTKGDNMQLEAAKTIAHTVKATLDPLCHAIEIAGSIRRARPFVNDIDIVLIPSPDATLIIDSVLTGMGVLELNGPKLKRLAIPHDNHATSVSVDIYIATPETWPTLLLIRTGSKDNNIRLCSLARTQGWHLKANGDGLFDQHGTRLAGDTEQSIYQALGVPYQEPSAREV